MKDGQTVIVWAGDFGLISLVNLLKEKCPEKMFWLQTNTYSYGARITPEGWIDWHVLLQNFDGHLPATNTDRYWRQEHLARLIVADI